VVSLLSEKICDGLHAPKREPLMLLLAGVSVCVCVWAGGFDVLRAPSVKYGVIYGDDSRKLASASSNQDSWSTGKIK